MGRDEDQFRKAERQARELLEDLEREIPAEMERRRRKAETAAMLPRFSALKTMAWQRLIGDHHGAQQYASAAVRRHALAKDPTFRSLPEPARRIWDEAVDGLTELLLEGSGDVAELRIEELAGQMASSEGLETWDLPVVETESPADLAALIPRG